MRKTSAKKVIDNAAAATARSERAIESALNLLKGERLCNAHGVYMDRSTVEAHLLAAWRDIRQAVDAISAINTPWPQPRDYEGV